MAKLTRLYDQLVIISRLAAVSGNRTKAMTTVTAVFGHLQPASLQQIQLTNGVFGKTYRIWCDGDVDILEGDELKDEASARYTVVKGGVTRYTHGIHDYKEVLIQRKTE